MFRSGVGFLSFTWASEIGGANIFTTSFVSYKAKCAAVGSHFACLALAPVVFLCIWSSLFFKISEHTQSL